MEIAPLLGASRKPQLTTGGGGDREDRQEKEREREMERGRKGGRHRGRKERVREAGREGGRCKIDAEKKESARE